MVHRTAAVTRVLDALVGVKCSVTGGLPSSCFYTHTRASCTSVFKSRASAAFLSLQRLWFDLCPVSVRSVKVKVAFGDFFCSSTLVFSC